MSETTFGFSRWSVQHMPLQFGTAIGIALGVLERFLIPFDMMTLGIGFIVVGAVLSRFGEPSWVDIGRALSTSGIAGILSLQLLLLF